MTIGALSKNSGVPTDTIRYYEKFGVLGEPARAENGYRMYNKEVLDILHFIRRAKAMAFTLEEIKELLTMGEEANTSVCGDILSIVENRLHSYKVNTEDAEIAFSMLSRFADDCPGGQVPAKKYPFIPYLTHGGKT